MDHLSSCYFCGAALEDPLQDYRVVPAELRDSDDVTTATLCPSCHAKLERLLGPVVEAAGAQGATLETRVADRQSAAEHDETPADPDDTPGEGTPTGDGSDAVEPEDDNRAELVDVEANLVDIDDDPLAESDTSGDDTGEATDTGASDHRQPTESDGEASDHDAAPDTAGVGNDDGQSETSDGDDATVRVTHTSTDERDDEGDSDAGADDEQAADSDGDTAQTTVSALEYNRVMRLLQNREFPLDRAEIQTVAANAYGLAEHECAEVIDLAIDRGLIAEQDGQLTRPE